MPLQNDLFALLHLQAAHSHADRTRAALAHLDTGAKIAQEYQSVRADADTKAARAHKAQTDQKDAELRLTSLEAKVADVNKSLYGGKITATRELENLQKELDMLARQKSAQEDTILEAMEAAGEASAEADAAEKAAGELANSYRTLRANYKTRHAELTGEQTVCETERQTALVPLAGSTALLTRYETLRKQKNGVAIAPLQNDGTCGACHTQLSSNLVDEIRAAKTVQMCEHCGRILSVAPPPVLM